MRHVRRVTVAHRRLAGLAAGAALLGLSIALPATAAAGHPCDAPNPPQWCLEEPDPGPIPEWEFNPSGDLGELRRVNDRILLSGSAQDPDPGAVEVRVTSDGRHVASVHTDATGTYAAAIPVDTQLGRHDVCAIAVNVGRGTANAGLGCRSYETDWSADGSLVKERGAPAVYVMLGHAKLWVPSAQEFDAMGYDWSSVWILDDGRLARVSNTPQSGTHMRERTWPFAGKEWGMFQGKRWLGFGCDSRFSPPVVPNGSLDHIEIGQGFQPWGCL